MRPVCSVLATYQDMRVFVLCNPFKFLLQRVFVFFSWSQHKWASCTSFWMCGMTASVVILGLNYSSICGIMQKHHLVELWLLSLRLRIIFVQKFVCSFEMLIEIIWMVVDVDWNFWAKCVTLLALFWVPVIKTFNRSDVSTNGVHIFPIFFWYALIKVENFSLISFDGIKVFLMQSLKPYVTCNLETVQSFVRSCS